MICIAIIDRGSYFEVSARHVNSQLSYTTASHGKTDLDREIAIQTVTAYAIKQS